MLRYFSALLLLLLVKDSNSFIQPGGTVQGREPFRSQKAPAETIANYSVVSPVISNSKESEHGDHPIKFTMEVNSFRVHLQQNSKLFPPHLTRKHFNERGEEVISHGHVNCFYQGWVEGHLQWRATLSTCHGLRGSFGEQSNPQQFYHIEPLHPENKQVDQPHVLYLDSEYTTREKTCGTPHSKKDDIKPYEPSDLLHGVTGARLRRQNSLGEMIVEWAVFNDMAQFARYGSLQDTVLRALEITNYVDMLYRSEYKIRIVLVYVETWSNSNRITVSSDPNIFLANFENYDISTHHDSAMVITGLDLAGSTVGLANVRAMCRANSRGLSQDFSDSVASTGATVAHELGHIFNMNHDDSPRPCSCSDPTGGCIMAASSGGQPPTQWSSCSREDLEAGLNEHNLGSCLTNEPTRTVGDPECGNGIREEDEICDCGTLEVCSDPCCNASSCQLVEGAECFSGGCCNECKFRPYGFVCRGSTQECDITDYCSGKMSECPEDARIQNGQNCNNNISYCYSGVCTSNDAMCQIYFNTNNGIEGCYTEYNVQGTEFGNCGSSNGAFIPCAARDVLCGQRFCENGDFVNANRITVRIFTVPSRDSNGQIQTCRAFTTPVDADTISPGLVSDGVKCGEDRICHTRRCLPVSDLNIPPCSSGSNGLICSGNGQCNTDNQCSCNVGFSGSTCESIVPIDGQPSSGGAIAGGIIVTLLIIALIVTIVIIVVIVVKKKKGTKSSYPRSSHTLQSQYHHSPSTNGKPASSVAVVQPGAAPLNHNGRLSQNVPSAPSRKAPAKPLPRDPPPKPPQPVQPHTNPTSTRNVHLPTRPVPPPYKPPTFNENVHSTAVKPSVSHKPTTATRPQPPPRPGLNSSNSSRPSVPKKPVVPPSYRK